MPVSPFKAFSATATSNTTYCSFDVGGAYESYTLVVPATTSQTTLTFEVSDSADGTYYPLYLGQTTASAPAQVQVASALTGCAVVMPNLGQFFRVVHVNLLADTSRTYTILCKGT